MIPGYSAIIYDRAKNGEKKWSLCALRPTSLLTGYTTSLLGILFTRCPAFCRLPGEVVDLKAGQNCDKGQSLRRLLRR
jgi:hypothetical protein